MKRVCLLFGILIVLFTVPSNAIELQSSQLELEIQAVRNSVNSLDGSFEDDAGGTGEIFGFDFNADESIYDYDYKSPKKAFVYSLLIPGWGQRYCGSNTLKTLGFLGLEAGLWMGYFKFHNDGQKKTDEFEAFASANWLEGNRTDPLSDTTSYWGWIYNTTDYDPDTELPEDKYTHNLPDTKTQQYYEMIGKYDQFAAGWRDYWDDVEYYSTIDTATDLLMYVTPMRTQYNILRGDANDLLDKANNFVIFVVLNHLASAFDAALAARRYNRNQANELWLSVGTELKKFSDTESTPIVKLSLTF